MVSFMVEKITEFGALSQPNSVPDAPYLRGMKKTDIREILWENVLALMHHHYGKSNLSRLTSELGWSPSDGTRLKEQETSTGIKKVQELAAKFGMEAWQLLVPNLKPPIKPVLGDENWPFQRLEKRHFEALSERDKGYVEAKLLEALKECAPSTRGNPGDGDQDQALNTPTGLIGAALPSALGDSADTKRAVNATGQSDLISSPGPRRKSQPGLDPSSTSRGRGKR
jgi:hypothetical protein